MHPFPAPFSLAFPRLPLLYLWHCLSILLPQTLAAAFQPSLSLNAHTSPHPPLTWHSPLHSCGCILTHFPLLLSSSLAAGFGCHTSQVSPCMLLCTYLTSARQLLKLWTNGCKHWITVRCQQQSHTRPHNWQDRFSILQIQHLSGSCWSLILGTSIHHWVMQACCMQNASHCFPFPPWYAGTLSPCWTLGIRSTTLRHSAFSLPPADQLFPW